MISWMQKHNKYLIVTIWVATIAFIGAGFVGWGSYQYGSKASAIGKVGDIDISQEKFDLTYQNLYNQYNEAFKGKFDEAKAKEHGLLKQAFGNLVSQAYLLNLAKEYGIVVSDEELGNYITTIKGFYDNGVFSEVVYKTYLKNRRLKAKIFEAILKDELKVQKLMKLLDKGSLPAEVKIVASALSISDKLAYKVISQNDIEVKLDDNELKKYWEETKNQYMSSKAYELSIYWTDSKDVKVEEKDLKEFYNKNSFNYTDASGKQFSFENAKDIVTQDFKIKKSKKQALLDYVAFKKGEKKSSEKLVAEVGTPVLSKALWEVVEKANVGDILKPKVVGMKYATVQIVNIIDPKEKSFDEAKQEVSKTLTIQKRKELLESRSKETLANLDSAELQTTDWLTMSKFDNITPLNQQETLQFLQKLFTSSDKKGIITVSGNVIVYKVVDQRISSVDNNLTKSVEVDTDKIKKSVFGSNLLKVLADKYPTRKYVKGI